MSGSHRVEMPDVLDRGDHAFTARPVRLPLHMPMPRHCALHAV
ncbi:MAG: hypothetical protein WBF87_04385 [Mesorhizobium sp.]